MKTPKTITTLGRTHKGWECVQEQQTDGLIMQRCKDLQIPMLPPAGTPGPGTSCILGNRFSHALVASKKTSKSFAPRLGTH